VVAFGELMLRLDAPSGDRLVQADAFEARYTGAEANVAASLSGFGIGAELVSVVPDHDLGTACLAYLRRFGVGTDHVLRRPGRLGLLFCELGGAGRAPAVLYDRAGSAFATCDPADYDWPAVLSGRSWLHVSGTAPALGQPVRAALDDALDAARALAVPVSLDLNYRASLWSRAEAASILEPLLHRVDVLLGSGPDAADLFGVRGDPDEGDAGVGWSTERHVQVADVLRERFDLVAVAGTVRRRRANGVDDLVGLAVDAGGAQVSRAYPIVDPIGRIGTGDAFAAGLLQGVLTGRPLTETVEFATAAAHLKQSIKGDVNLVTVAEVEAAMTGGPTDRVRR
jgi:2-dehydro-3-deoxygluconokinase